VNTNKNHGSLNHVTFGSLIVTLGIIFGDIGTSPLYVMKAIVGDQPVQPDIILGAVSCIFYTLTIQTTIKYVIITLKADNRGEGGIFSLYTLVKRLKKRWLIIPAIIGGSALLADGIITPPISIASAIEGLKTYKSDLNTIYIVIAILTFLFTLQQYGTKLIGRFFGPLMLIWFTMLGVLGGIHLFTNLEILKALNPYYAFHLLSVHHEGFYVLGFVFLCTTGAEALYSDLGHCGVKNIRVSWMFVKTTLLLNYFGQGAYLLNFSGKTLQQLSGDAANPGNPFYLLMPEWFMPVGIAVATMAAVIASQALITGSFTLIGEAIRLNLWPRITLKYPTEFKGQIYIPAVNWLLFAGCVFVMLHFKKSSEMEAAYGLAIVMCMLMTTVLLGYFMYMKRYNPVVIILFLSAYFTIEMAFFIANVSKFAHGGYVSLFIAGVIAWVMIVWSLGKKIRSGYTEYVRITDYTGVMSDLIKDETLPKYASHLVYMTNASNARDIESSIIYSILRKRPKRADTYWFLHVNVTDDPFQCDYKVTEIKKGGIIRVDFYLGFKVSQRVNLLFKRVLEDLVRCGELDITSRYASLHKHNITGDFKFVLIDKIMSYDNELPWYESIILDTYNLLKKLSLNDGKAFGLDSSSVKIEQYPIVIHLSEVRLHRIK